MAVPSWPQDCSENPAARRPLSTTRRTGVGLGGEAAKHCDVKPLVGTHMTPAIGACDQHRLHPVSIDIRDGVQIGEGQ